jgi:cytochrome c553
MTLAGRKQLSRQPSVQSFQSFICGFCKREDIATKLGTSRGEAIARSGSNGKTVPCASCHGPDLKGVGPAPSIAGRSPSYVVRQLYDFQQGARAGSLSALMKPAVENLAVDDMIALAAYLASLVP